MSGVARGFRSAHGSGRPRVVRSAGGRGETWYSPGPEAHMSARNGEKARAAIERRRRTARRLKDRASKGSTKPAAGTSQKTAKS